MIPPINQTILEEAIKGSNFDIISSINSMPQFWLPKAIALTVSILLFFFIGCIFGKKQKWILTSNFWILFIPFLFLILFFFFGELFPIYYMVIN